MGLSLAELLTERDEVRASIRRITGTATEPGAQNYSATGRSLQRASLEVLYKRLDSIELAIQRNGGTSGTDGAGMGSNPIYGVK